MIKLLHCFLLQSIKLKYYFRFYVPYIANACVLSRIVLPTYFTWKIFHNNTYTSPCLILIFLSTFFSAECVCVCVCRNENFTADKHSRDLIYKSHMCSSISFLPCHHNYLLSLEKSLASFYFNGSQFIKTASVCQYNCGLNCIFSLKTNTSLIICHLYMHF